MKRKNIIKRIMTLLLTAVIMLGLLSDIPAKAAKGDVRSIEFENAYDSNGNLICYQGSAKVDGILVGGKGEARPIIYVNGDAAFCLEPGRSLHAGDKLKESSSTAWNNLSSNKKKAIKLILLYGFNGNKKNLSGNSDEKWIATQVLIWEIVNGSRKASGDFARNDKVVYNLLFADGANATAKKAYDEIVAELTKHNTIPSFMSTSKTGAKKELTYSEDGTYSIELTDSNKVLGDYKLTCSNTNITLTKDGNKLTVSTTVPIEGSARITATRNDVPKVAESAKIIAYGDDSLQDVVTGVAKADDVLAYANVRTTTGSLDIIKTSEDGVVAGITFHVIGEDHDEMVTTGADGKITIEGLSAGTYTIEETVYDQYNPQEIQTVTVVGGQTATVSFNNTLKRGNLQVIKSAEDNFKEGLQFHLFGASMSGIPVDMYATTDANGVATFADVPISGAASYTLEEVNTPDRYVVPKAENVVIEWNKVLNRDVININKKFNVTLKKQDAERISAQGDGTLAGAVYGIYKAGELVDTYTTDEKGSFTTKNYLCDNDWTIKEISPSEGYLLDDTVYQVGAEPIKYSIEVNPIPIGVGEMPIKGDIAIIKHTDDGSTKIETPEAGAVFEVYLKNAGSYEAANDWEKDTITCDENGFAKTKKMPFGVYVVHQVSGWEGRELMKDFDAFISKDSVTYRYLINNSEFESYIRIVKKDSETEKQVPYAGAGFQIYDADGKLITMKYTYPELTILDTFYTNAEGELITPEMLPYGRDYSLVEVAAPFGYVLDATPIPFDVTEDNSTKESELTIIKVERYNTPQKGRITVEKQGEFFATVTEKDGIYHPEFVKGGLSGAEYEITAKEDIITQDGTIRAEKGEVVDTVTTDESGKAISKELYLGKYEVKETKAPYGMVINNTPVETELVYAGQEVSVTESSVSFENERQRVDMNLIKFMEKDENYKTGMGEEYKDVLFGLYAAVEIEAQDGMTIPADGLIEQITIDENGYGKAATDLPFGDYYLKEIATNNAYKVTEETYPLSFSYAGQEIETVNVTANEGKEIINEIQYGTVKGLKVNEDGDNLAGAVIGIFKPDVTEFTKETAAVTVVTGGDGTFCFDKVPFGAWIIREVESPEGYVLLTESYLVTVGDETEVIELHLVNQYIRGNVTLTKVDKKHLKHHLTGAVFEIFKDSNGNGKYDKEDEKVGKMEELKDGVYQMTGLKYGTYFVKEKKAPKGYILDKKAYPVTIKEDGKTYVVENEAGKGFVNKKKPSKPKVPKTGDFSKIGGWIALFVIFILGGGLTIYAAKIFQTGIGEKKKKSTKKR